MSAQSPSRLLSKKISKLYLIVLFITAATFCHAATVNINPGDDIPSIVAANPPGTTFLIYPGTYRLQNHIVPQNGDSFIGQTACAPPTTSCPAILSGSTVIGPLAVFDGTNYEVTGQTQQGVVSEPDTVCQPGYLACNLPEDLYFDGVPYQHLYATSLPTIGPGQWWFDYTNHIIYFHDNPAGHTVETSVLDTVFDSTANNVTVEYLTVEEFADPLQEAAIQPAPATPLPTSSLDWVVTNCQLFNNHGAGLRIAFGARFSNNYIYNNGQQGIGGGTSSTTASDVTIQGNTITQNNYAHVMAAHGAGGIKIGNTVGVVIRGNTITNNDGAGVHFDSNASNPVVDGNVISNNAGGGGVEYEISVGGAVIRNNLLLGNGVQDSMPANLSNLGSYDSVGVKAYCNVIEVPYVAKGNGEAANAMTVVASDRGNNQYPPYEYLVSTGNSFHHNTVIWDPNASGVIGYNQLDAAHQPDFFADNEAPDYNTYHLPSLSTANFVYDNNNTQQNTHKTFAEFQAAGADLHGSADANNTSGFPSVAITSPLSGSSFTNSVTIETTASDPSGISKVELYVDWKLQATMTSSPYNYTWSNATTGWHTVAAMAYSKAGIQACYAVPLQKP